MITKTGNAILLHENYVLKNVESVETVVKKFGQGIWDVQGHNVLALHSVPTGTTDQRALEALNVNDMLTIAAQLLETFKQAHEFETQHLALTLRHLLYDQVSKIVIVSSNLLPDGEAAPAKALNRQQDQLRLVSRHSTTFRIKGRTQSWLQ